MEKREVRRKSARTVPVIIENHENAARKTKLMVPSNYTAGQLVNILRSRMHLRPSHPVYLFLKSKQSPVLMSKSIGHLHNKHRDEKGLLRLIHAGQTSFGFRGNIRAIRFRQKWIENLHSTMQQGAGGLQSYSDMPPSYFPLEPPTATNFGAPLDVDSLSDSNEEMPVIEDFYIPEFTVDYSPLTSDMPSWPSNITIGSSQSDLTNSSQSSGFTSSSHSSALTDPWLSSGVADPWQPSATTNSGQTTGTSNSSLFASHEEGMNAFYLEMDLALASLHNAASSVFAIPSIPASVQPPDVPNPQVPPNNVSLYESDSDWYDEETDVDMNDDD